MDLGGDHAKNYSSWNSSTPSTAASGPESDNQPQFGAQLGFDPGESSATQEREQYNTYLPYSGQGPPSPGAGSSPQHSRASGAGSTYQQRRRPSSAQKLSLFASRLSARFSSVAAAGRRPSSVPQSPNQRGGGYQQQSPPPQTQSLNTSAYTQGDPSQRVLDGLATEYGYRLSTSSGANQPKFGGFAGNQSPQLASQLRDLQTDKRAEKLADKQRYRERDREFKVGGTRRRGSGDEVIEVASGDEEERIQTQKAQMAQYLGERERLRAEWSGSLSSAVDQDQWGHLLEAEEL